MKRRIKSILILLPCSVAAGVLLLMIIFLLPVDSAREHAKESLYQMSGIMEDPDGDPQRKAIVAVKENFTDFLMVQNALEKVEGKNILEHAMNIYHYDLQAEDTTWLTEKSLAAFLQQGSQGLYLKNYAKYWHGYLIYLKPLLICMTWENAEKFLLAAQILLMGAVLAAAWYRKKPYLGLGAVCAFLFMKPVRIWYSLAMSVCWTITLAAILVLILSYDRIRSKNRQEEVFLMIGILTAYMDFLTYPVVTLGVPLCVWLVQSMEEEGRWQNRIKKVFWVCACWIAGYIGMWGMKWVVSEITCATGALRDAAWSVIYRTSPLDGYQSFFSGISRTFDSVIEQYDSVWYGIALSLLVLAALVSAVVCLVKARCAKWAATMVCLAVTALFPFGWMVLTQNHTAIHCVFTFRIFGVTVMALWCMTVCSVLTLKRKAVRDEAS